jgi:hypothetical protein
MYNPQTLEILGTRKTKQMRNTIPTKIRGHTQVLAKGKQFILRIRNPPCYSYSPDVLNTTVHTHTHQYNINTICCTIISLLDRINIFFSKGTAHISTFFGFNIILQMKTLQISIYILPLRIC